VSQKVAVRARGREGGEKRYAGPTNASNVRASALANRGCYLLYCSTFSVGADDDGRSVPLMPLVHQVVLRSPLSMPKSSQCSLTLSLGYKTLCCRWSRRQTTTVKMTTWAYAHPHLWAYSKQPSDLVHLPLDQYRQSPDLAVASGRWEEPR
jgi:hypothetical protein